MVGVAYAEFTMRIYKYAFGIVLLGLVTAWATSNCVFCDGEAPDSPQDFTLTHAQIKQFDFTWSAANGADTYKLLELRAPGTNYVQVGEDTTSTKMSIVAPLHLRHRASYVVRACNDFGCTDSAAAHVDGSMVEAIGYFKASNTQAHASFGGLYPFLELSMTSIALSKDGTTLAVGAADESKGAGAVHVFVRDEQNRWMQQSHIVASNADEADSFGRNVALAHDGHTLAVGATMESGGSTGIGGDQTDNSAQNAGAVYVFGRNEQDTWSQQAYIKASNAEKNDFFGVSVALSGDGTMLAVGAPFEDGGANDDPADNSAENAGAVYVFGRDGQAAWSQHAYIKNFVIEADHAFGWSMALSGDGTTLAAIAGGAVCMFTHDGSDAWSQQGCVHASSSSLMPLFGYTMALSNNGSTLAVGAPWDHDKAGATYVFTRDERSTWSQQARLAASNAAKDDFFGNSVAISADGSVVAVGAPWEDSHATGLAGNEDSDLAPDAGAVYVFVRDRQDAWSQQVYLKASNTKPENYFGNSVALSGDGTTLAVGALDGSSATGIGGDQLDNSAPRAGAVYLY